MRGENTQPINCGEDSSVTGARTGRTRSTFTSRSTERHRCSSSGRSELERRPQIRHAASRGVVFAPHRNRRAHARVQFDEFAVEELAADTVAIGFQKLAAIHEVRHRNRIDLSLIRPAVVRKAERADPKTRFPQRFLLRAARLFRDARRAERTRADRGERRRGLSLKRMAATAASRCPSRDLQVW